MAIQEIKNQVNLVGLSTDTKPTKLGSEDIGAGSTFWESDKDTLYVFDGNSWFVRVLQYQDSTTGYAGNLKGASGVAHVTGPALTYVTYSDATYTYYCEAAVGTARSAAAWQVSRKTNATGDIVYASTGAFDQAATSLAVVGALTYTLGA